MKGCRYWSYSPYRPPLCDVGDIYICRVAPSADSIHIDWLGTECAEYSVYCRVRGEGEFSFCSVTSGNGFDIVGLADKTDYEFYVESENKKSRVRLAKTGKVEGVVVNYLHPDDNAYSFSGKYLCSPSLVRHPDGYLLASMDLYAGGAPQNLTLIFRSDDNGESWNYVSELMPCFWGKMFIHKGELYMLSVSTEYGDLLIGRSSDGGKSFSAPVALLRGSGSKTGRHSGVHKNPQPIVEYKGRLYGTLEWAPWGGCGAMVMSCDVDADLLDPNSWSFSEPVILDEFSPEMQGVQKGGLTIEGTIVLSPEGRLLNVMRTAMRGKALMYEIDTENPEKPLSYYGIMPFEANLSKFMIKYDEKTGRYYSVATRLYDGCPDSARNLMSLMSSANLREWKVVCDLHDHRNEDVARVGFQYADFEFDGEDVIYLCRTAVNGAHSYHDSNYSTFHRIENFRKI